MSPRNKVISTNVHLKIFSVRHMAKNGFHDRILLDLYLKSNFRSKLKG